MACGRIAFVFAIALGSLTITSAEEGSGHHEERVSFQGPGGNFGFSMGSGSLFGGSNGSNPFEAFLSAFRPNSGGSNGSSSGSPFSFLPFLSGNRQEEVAAPADLQEGDDNPENRLFFGLLSNLFSTPTSCNYTTQPGLTCLSCTQRLQCFSSNVGRLTRCSFKKPYCNNGFCSKFPGAACFATSTTTTAATTTGGTTTT